MATSLSQGWQDINSKLNSITTYKKASQDSKQLQSDAANSDEPSLEDVATQLNKIKEQQKR